MGVSDLTADGKAGVVSEMLAYTHFSNFGLTYGLWPSAEHEGRVVEPGPIRYRDSKGEAAVGFHTVCGALQQRHLD